MNLPDLPEKGYTPRNLRVLQRELLLSNIRVAELIGDNPRNVIAWRADFGHPSHKDMPASKWRVLMDALTYE